RGMTHADSPFSRGWALGEGPEHHGGRPAPGPPVYHSGGWPALGSRLGPALPVVVDPLPRLPAEAAGLYVLLEQRAGAVLLAQGLVQEAEDLEPGIEAHQIDELEGTHRMVEPALQRLVDVGGRGDTFLQHVEGFVPDQRVHPRRDEARRLVDLDRFLSHRSEERRV